MKKRIHPNLLNFARLIAIFVVLLPSAIAVGVVPSTVNLNYEPFAEYNIAYAVSGYNNLALEMGCPFVTYNNDVVVDGTTHRFSVNVKFPEKLDADPGIINCGFLIHEVLPKNFQGVGGRAEVGTNIFVNVPYKGRYASISLDAPNAKKGEPVDFVVHVSNLGEEVLSGVSAKIIVKDIQNKTKEILYTTSDNVQLFESTELWAQLDTNDYEPARYNAEAILEYGGKKPAIDSKTFFIGTLFVDFIKMTDQVLVGKINPVYVDVQSWWGDPVKNVYADVKFSNASGYDAGEMRTVSNDLSPWASASLMGYWDSSMLPEGNYDADIAVHYEDKVTNVNAKIAIVSEIREEEPFSFKAFVTSPAFIVIILIIILLFNIGMWIFRRKSKGDKKSKDKR